VSEHYTPAPRVPIFRIDKNIPIIDQAPVFPFDLLAVGHSFFVDAPYCDEARRAAAAYIQANEGVRFAIGREFDGIRIWRAS
jgi:hypothetical protein